MKVLSGRSGKIRRAFVAAVLPLLITAAAWAETVQPVSLKLSAVSEAAPAAAAGAALAQPVLPLDAATPGFDPVAAPAAVPAAEADPELNGVLKEAEAASFETSAVRSQKDQVGAPAWLGRLFDKQGAGAKMVVIPHLRGDDGQNGSNDKERQAKAMHDEWERLTNASMRQLQAKVAKVRVGRLKAGLKIVEIGEKMKVQWLTYVDGKPAALNEVASLLAHGRILGGEYIAFEKALAPYQKELAELADKMARTHEAVHQDMDKLMREDSAKREAALSAQGMDLQAWGVPEAISINQEKRLRYARLYRMGGQPTNLGRVLHEVLAPMVKADPNFLSQVTQAQLHAAVQFLHDSLKYKTDIGSDDLQKARRLGMRVDEGYDYPEWRKALADRAAGALKAPARGSDASAGLALRPAERQPVAVLKKVLSDVEAKLERMIDAKAPDNERAKQEELYLALHAAMAIPIPVSQDQMAMVPITHDQLPVILRHLRERQVHNDVVEAMIRAFPMGESLLRLGVHKLWEKGITGEGLTVAVIDNGVDFNHPDLASSKHESENFTRDVGDHTKGGHGTPMASILHAIAPNAKIFSEQVLPNVELPGPRLSGEEINKALIDAMDRARAKGAQIISMSLGAAMGYGSGPLEAKVAELVKAGITVVIAAGNEGDELPNGYQVGSPGTAPEAITVGAVDYHGNKAYFSSAGQVFNPADFSVSDKPEIYTYGLNVKSAVQLPAALYAQEPVPYTYVSGTSPATPHISGVVALMLEAAKKAGVSVEGAALPHAVKSALVAAVDKTNKLPILQSAEAATQELLKLLSKPSA